MTRSKKSKLERMAGKLVGMTVSHDDNGNYLNYCSYGVHPGVVGKKKAVECEEKCCRYLRKYREEK